MKKYHSIIKLIVITSALAGLGVVAFKHFHNAKSTTTTDGVEIQTTPFQNMQKTFQSAASNIPSQHPPVVVSKSKVYKMLPPQAQTTATTLQSNQTQIQTTRGCGVAGASCQGNSTYTGPTQTTCCAGLVCLYGKCGTPASNKCGDMGESCCNGLCASGLTCNSGSICASPSNH